MAPQLQGLGACMPAAASAHSLLGLLCSGTCGVARGQVAITIYALQAQPAWGLIAGCKCREHAAFAPEFACCNMIKASVIKPFVMQSVWHMCKGSGLPPSLTRAIQQQQ
eukprot:350905-Chlamydomonas_euryale.AAC.4